LRIGCSGKYLGLRKMKTRRKASKFSLFRKYYANHIKKDEMGRACRIDGR
jgi:hypothetical protein